MIGLDLEVLVVDVISQVIVAGIHVPMNVKLPGICLAQIRRPFDSLGPNPKNNISHAYHIFMGRIEISVNEFIAVETKGSELSITKDGFATGTILVRNASILGINDLDEETMVSSLSSSVDTLRDSTFLPSPSSAQQKNKKHVLIKKNSQMQQFHK